MTIAALALAGAAAIALPGPAAGAADRRAEVPADAAIADAISDRLLVDDGVHGHAIDVRVDDGIVTLTGTADNLLARERAARIAETVRGVRSVIDQVTVVPVGRSDDALLGDVRTALLRDPHADAFDVRAGVDDGVVHLTGTVQSPQEKLLAEKVVAGVRGVTAVTNDLAVVRAERTDTEIAEDVRGALHWDRYVSDLLLDAEVEDGVVRLTGTVGSASERTRAIRKSWVAGVTRVDASDLEVDSSFADPLERAPLRDAPSDGAIATAIREALLLDPRLVSQNVEVDVDDGVATLRGEVDLLQGRLAAAQTARNTVGVARVRNFIRVRPDTRRPAGEIDADIEAAWAHDPYVTAFDLEAFVHGGVATLDGVVDSRFEKARAERLARRVDGVREISNDIEVVRDDPLVFDPFVDEWYPYDFEWNDFATTTTKSDLAIRQDVRDELFWSPFVDADRVRVTVADGVATLTGTVDSWIAREAATTNALEGGAIRVVNELDVERASASSDVGGDSLASMPGSES